MNAPINLRTNPVFNVSKRLPAARLIGAGGLGLLLVLAFLWLLQPARPAAAAVSGTSRTFPGAAPCDTTLQNCINGSTDGDTIDLQSGVYTESLTLNKAVSLIGAGAGSTILQAPPGQRVLLVSGVMNSPTRISNLMIRGGNAGAANGGGIFLATGAQPLIQDIQVTANSAQSGGGIYASSSITLSNVTLDNNSATNGSGGGLYAASNVLAVNSIIQANTVITNGNGGGMLVVGNLAGTNLDFIGNAVHNGYDGGGLYVSGALTMTNGQFAQNQTTRSKGYGGGGGAISFGLTNITGTMFISNTSSDWGGGAYLAYFSNTQPSTLTNVQFISNTANSGGGGGLFMWFDSDLNNVEFRANLASYRGGGVYAGYAGNYKTRIEGGTIQANTANGGGGLYSDSSFTISGTQVLSNTSLSGNGGGTWTPANATLTNVYIAHNTVITAGNSGGVDTGGSITITNSTFFQNQTLTGSGGGSGAGANALLDHVTYDGNTAYNLGGGLIVYGGARVSASQFGNNHSQHNWGGGFYASQASIVTDTQFVGNDSAYAGGGVGVQYGSLQVTGGLFESNTAAVGGWGGAIYSGGPSLTISGTRFISNTAEDPGGATASNTTILTNTLYRSNTAGGVGGGGVAFGPLQVSGSLFQGNQAGTSGGGLQVGSQITVSRSSFIANTAADGGGLYQSGGGGSIVNSLFAGNLALSTSGDALYLVPTGTTRVLQTTLAGPALIGGSALYAGGGTTDLVNTIIANHNLGILQSGGTVNADYTLFFGNLLNTQGGGISNNHPLSGDPAFFNPLLNDYHLGTGSAAVDIGTNSGVGLDFDGDARPQGSGFDIGYDESVPPENLSAVNDGPTQLGSPTSFTASLNFGRAVSYSWDFGDGTSGTGNPAVHVYTAPGTYQAAVTASNGAGSLTSSTSAQVFVSIYLPLVVH